MDEITAYALDTENARKNYELALWYEKQNHTAPALTFYLRASERCDKHEFLLAYICLIRGFFCYDKQGSRDASSKILLENAITFLPDRPEAYYLLAKFYRTKEEWQQAYIYANLALTFCNTEESIISPDEYAGKYALLYEKALSGYWWGRGLETRQICQELIDEYWEEMDEFHQGEIKTLVMNLGSAPANHAFRPYTRDRYDQFEMKFDGIEKVDRNHSQVLQDMFVLYTYNGKQNGTYLEIGGGDPVHLNNTYLLESQYDWSGVSVEINSDLCNKYSSVRKNDVYCRDATELNYKKLLESHYDSNVIDYLQLDCEPSRTTFEVLLSIPFDDYKFGVITYEHDHYNDTSRTYRERSRKYLNMMGYILIVPDVAPTPWSSFEDWWVHPDLVDVDKMLKLSNNDGKVHQVDEYFYRGYQWDIRTPLTLLGT